MKILIADDDSQRYSVLMEKILPMGLDSDSVVFCRSISEIRQTLADDDTYDLMVLDLLLPMRPTDEATTTQHTMDLMRELPINSDLKRPANLIGITGDLTLHREHSIEFKNYAWTLLEYDRTSDKWINTLVQSISYLLGVENVVENKPEKIDLAIICALEHPELSQVLQLPWNWQAPAPLDSTCFFWRGSFTSDGRQRTVIAVHQPQMGMVPAALLTSKLMSNFDVGTIAMLGICAGIEGKSQIGESIFAETVWDYQAGRINSASTGPTFEAAPVQLHASVEAASAIRLLASEDILISEISSRFRPFVGLEPKLTVAPVATGSAVIADGEYVAAIVKQNRKLRGIEMEIYGVYAAAYNFNFPTPKFYAIKTVCDLANSEKNDNFQDYASYMSAQILAAAIERHPKQMLVE